MYPFYHWANHNRAFLVLLVLSFGYAIIILKLFKKILRYMNEIINAMEEIYRKDDELITLSGDLKEVNDKMNKIKFKLRENEKIARDSEKRKNDLIIYLENIGFEAFFFFGALVFSASLFLFSNSNDPYKDAKSLPIDIELFKTDKGFALGSLLICAIVTLIYVLLW